MKPNDREKGQSIIVIAFAVIILLALVALVVDVGNAYAHRRIIQNALDAAALAGARRLAERGIGETVLEIQVLNDIQRFAEINGLSREVIRAWFIDADGDQLETIDPWLGPAPDDAEGVEVGGDLPFRTYFAQILGFRSLQASTTAKAWVLTGLCGAENLFPLTISTGTFTETAGVPEIGHIYTLWDHNRPRAPGNWGWLYWKDGDGNCRCPYGDECCPQTPAADNLGDNIDDNTRSGGWAVGDWVNGGSGTMIGGTLDDLFPYVTDVSRDPVIIPLYDQIRGSGNNTQYHISAFAAFEMRCIFSSMGHYAERVPGDCAPCKTGRSSDKCIRGEFVDWIVPAGQDGCQDTGIYIPSFRKPR